MRRRTWIGLGIGLLSALVLVGVGLGAYRAGQRADREVVVERQVQVREDGPGRFEDGETAVVRVEREGVARRPFGPGPVALVVIALLGFGLLFVLARGGNRSWGPGGPGGWDRSAPWGPHPTGASPPEEPAPPVPDEPSPS